MPQMPASRLHDHCNSLAALQMLFCCGANANSQKRNENFSGVTWVALLTCRGIAVTSATNDFLHRQ